MAESALRPRWLLVAVAIAAAAAWFLFRLRAEQPSRAAEQPRPATVDPEASRATVAAVHAAGTAAPPTAPTTLPIVGPGPPQVPDGFAHPHPITPRHREIQHENGLLMLLNDAMSAGRGARMRELVRQYRESHPRDRSRLQEGYAVIAECLENPGDASRAAGERYYAEHRASTLRRFVRRYCIEGS